MSALVHGGDVAAFQKAFPQARLPIMDLSTGINPHAYSDHTPEPMLAARLPDSAAHSALCETFAAYASADRRMVMAVPGSQSAISLLPYCFQQGSVAIVSPTYNEHGAGWVRAGHRVHEATLEACLGAAPDVLVLVNPNNPTGDTYEREQVRDWLSLQEAHGGYLIVDEAFIDMEPERSVSDMVTPEHRLIVLRSFGKFFGLAGLRLGFCIAPPGLQKKLASMLGPWPIATPTLEVATQAYKDTPWIDAMQVRLKTDSQRLKDLASASGLLVRGGCPLFLLLQHPQMGHVANRLASDGIYVRTFPDHPDWARWGLPADEASWTRLETSLQNLNLKGTSHG